MIDVTHIPKGGMCAGCFYINANCSNLPFNKMPVIVPADENNLVIVRCTSHRKPENTGTVQPWK